MTKSYFLVGRQAGGLAAFIWAAAPGRAALTLALMILSTLTDSISILLLLPFLAHLGAEANSHSIPIDIPVLGQPSLGFHLSLLQLLVTFILLVGISNYIGRLKTVVMAEMLLGILNDLRFDLFKGISEARWSFIASQRVADLDHALTGDIDRVQSAMTNLILFIQNAILVLIFAILSCAISVYVTALVSILGLLLLLLMAPFRAKAASFGASVTRERKFQYRATSDFLLGLKVAKSFNAQYQYQAQFISALVNLKRLTVSFAKLNSNAGFLFQTLTSVAACVFIYVSFELLSLPTPRILILIVIFSRISPRLLALQGYMQAFATNFSAFENMESIRAAARNAREPIATQGHREPRFDTLLEMKGVCFRYDTREVLHHVDLTIEQKQVTALVGPSGSGKSTVADLLLGLHFPTAGEILIDGVPLGSLDLQRWRGSYVSYVQQDAFLFAGSLRDNLRLAHPSATDDEIWQSLEKSQAKSFVQRLPMGLDTPVGDGAVAFSGGEKQRLSLARAIVRVPKLLILDEATSGLDAVNTALITELIRALAQNMAILIITHDEAVAAVASRKIVMTDGYCHQELVDGRAGEHVE